MQIVDLRPDDMSAISQVAALTGRGFCDQTGLKRGRTWNRLWREVRKSFAEGHISRVALDEDGAVLEFARWGISQYDGHIWELHPLVVRVIQQRKGIGRAL